MNSMINVKIMKCKGIEDRSKRFFRPDPPHKFAKTPQNVKCFLCFGCSANHTLDLVRSAGFEVSTNPRQRSRVRAPSSPPYKPKIIKGLWRVTKSRSTCGGAEVVLKVFAPFFMPASNTIVITRLLASRFVAEMARV